MIRENAPMNRQETKEYVEGLIDINNQWIEQMQFLKDPKHYPIGGFNSWEEHYEHTWSKVIPVARAVLDQTIRNLPYGPHPVPKGGWLNCEFAARR